MISLKDSNTYRLNVHAKNVFYPSSVNELLQHIERYPEAIILGNGSNIIFSKEIYIDEHFIIFDHRFATISHEDNGRVVAQAGTLLKNISLFALDYMYTGLEVFYDIPGSVGGALWMNAGAYGSCIYDYIEEVSVLNRETKRIVSYHKSAIEFSYRSTMFQNSHDIIISATFKLSYLDRGLIFNRMQSIFETRQNKLPFEPSAGSVFKRPKYHISVGEMVENLGLKGYKIGGAMISEKHGGIIINRLNAKSSDIDQLINLIKHAVRYSYGVHLELEQIFL